MNGDCRRFLCKLLERRRPMEPEETSTHVKCCKNTRLCWRACEQAIVDCRYVCIPSPQQGVTFQPPLTHSIHPRPPSVRDVLPFPLVSLSSLRSREPTYMKHCANATARQRTYHIRPMASADPTYIQCHHQHRLNRRTAAACMIARAALESSMPFGSSRCGPSRPSPLPVRAGRIVAATSAADTKLLLPLLLLLLLLLSLIHI